METLRADKLMKTWPKGRVVAVHDITFSVSQGELFGFIGPDGAGKTTLFRILTTLLLPDSGSFTLLGLDGIGGFREIRSRIGYMPGRFSLYSDLTVEENLRFFATLFKTTIEENYHIIKEIYVQIEPFRNRRAGKLSGGMKQKLALCCALIHKPEVLFLDEPTTGIDPVSRRELWQMLKNLRGQGLTILVSTPYMDEAVLCDRIALMHKGRILLSDTPEGICRAFPGRLYAVRHGSMYHLLNTVRQYPATESCYPFGEVAHVTFSRQGGGAGGLLPFLESRGISGADMSEVEAGVEDLFLKLIHEQDG